MIKKEILKQVIFDGSISYYGLDREKLHKYMDKNSKIFQICYRAIKDNSNIVID